MDCLSLHILQAGQRSKRSMLGAAEAVSACARNTLIIRFEHNAAECVHAVLHMLAAAHALEGHATSWYFLCSIPCCSIKLSRACSIFLTVIPPSRMDQVDVNIAVFTNLAADAAEAGGEQDALLAAKGALFRRLSDPNLQRAIINIDGVRRAPACYVAEPVFGMAKPPLLKQCAVAAAPAQG